MSETPFTNGWLTLQDVSKILLISPTSVRRLIASGSLRARNASTSKTRPMWRIHPNWLTDFAMGLPVQPEKEEAPNATMQTSEN